jgi:sugar O-acyltransferase (sialic acid O-acetyltransferase NeuD family)
MKRPLIIVGLGKFAEIAKLYFNEFSDFEVVGFAAHKDFIVSDKFCTLNVYDINLLETIFPKDKVYIFVAIGYRKMNKIRQSVYEELKASNFQFASFVHPNVKYWSNSKVGKNCFIFEDNTLQPFVEIGDNTILWSGNHIGHHSVIGSNCFISSQVVVSGSCKIGDNSFLGVNSTIYDGITVAEENFVGPGAIVASNTKPKNVYFAPTTKSFIKSSDEIDF